MILLYFLLDFLKLILRGGRLYWLWIALLMAFILLGLVSYGLQVGRGLILTGMSDQVSWGLYIANFTFLVGVAAAAVMLVIPAYLFHHQDIKEVVILGEGIAIAATMACILFVTVDLGRPDRLWHLIPLLGEFNFPLSLLAWDMVVLNVYLLLNLGLAFYLLFSKYLGVEPELRSYFWVVLISIGWAISIHTITAFLYSANAARPFWSTAVLAPRFLASAFASGPAFILLILQLLNRITEMKISPKVLSLLGYIITVSLQIHLFLLGVEIFTEFYADTEHSASAQYLFFGFNQHTSLVPWIWGSIVLTGSAAVILSVGPLRRRRGLFNAACAMTVVGIWIEKGMGMVIPGFIPTPIGEVLEYSPSLVEILISLGIWCAGGLVFTLFAKLAIAVHLGKMRYVAKENEDLATVTMVQENPA